MSSKAAHGGFAKFGSNEAPIYVDVEKVKIVKPSGTGAMILMDSESSNDNCGLVVETNVEDTIAQIIMVRRTVQVTRIPAKDPVDAFQRARMM